MEYLYQAKKHVPRKSLDLDLSLFCGQAFRWKKSSSGYEAIVKNTKLLFYHSGDFLYLKSSSEMIGNETFDTFIENYFNLSIPFNCLFSSKFKMTYPNLYKQLSPYRGLKLLKQDPFEILISFMCAQGISIPLIRRQITFLCELFGEPLGTNDFCFPKPEALAKASISELKKATNNNLERAKNIKLVSIAVYKGILSLHKLENSNYENARNKLLCFKGIGQKIADCICLFGLGFLEALPIDRHVRNFLNHWFNLNEPTLSPKNYLILSRKATDILGGPYAGAAHQLLFHYWRTVKRGLKSV